MPTRRLIGAPIGLGDLDEASEHRHVVANRGHGILVPFLRHDPRAEPIVLVHGINASPADLKTVADHLGHDPRFQVYVYFYEDRRRYVDASGLDLALALDVLREQSPTVRIVAHSMGGIVTRCAVNSLIDPGWLADTGRRIRGVADADEIVLPGIHDFAGLDIVTVDTPWRGFFAPRINLRNLLVRERSFVDMVSNSAVLTNIHRVHLPDHVRIHQVEADNRAAGEEVDRIIGLCDLGADELDRLIDYFSDHAGALGDDRELRNQLLALREDVDFAPVDRAIRLDAQRGRLDRARLRQHLRDLVPAIPGTHVSVLDRRELLAVLDRTFGRSR